jgi:uncharacterized FAD-dependent dehydrogenase
MLRIYVAKIKYTAISAYFCCVSIRVQITCSPEQSNDVSWINEQLRQQAGLGANARVRWVKRSLDARSKIPFFIISGEVFSASEPFAVSEHLPLQNVSSAAEVHIIGAGPAGLFAALQCISQGKKPIILERGKEVKRRRRDLASLNKEGVVNPDSNYCFGEGGAGTYSDGKLYTRSKKRGSVITVLDTLVHYGADPVIQYEAHPHIGTNKLPGIIENIREAIIEAGGEVRFDMRVTDFIYQNDRITHLEYNGNAREAVQSVILATGHSARDIFEWFHRNKRLIEVKPFALGVRMEHPQEIIDQIQYNCALRGPYLPPSSYSLVEQVKGAGVFSFCMCPGGIIAPAATAPGEVVVNGWSPSKRNGSYANSGFVVSVDEKDFAPFAKSGTLQGLEFQSHWERKAFQLSGSIQAPAQRMEDFLQKKTSTTLPPNSYIPGLVSADIRMVLPPQVSDRIAGALLQISKKMLRFRTNEAILVGVESRTSSPVRIPRDAVSLQHPELLNLYPCGEGPGYAGGIMSAAMDGIKVADLVCHV